MGVGVGFENKQASALDRFIGPGAAALDHLVCWPGRQLLARTARCDPRHVKRCLRHLEDLGQIRTIEADDLEPAFCALLKKRGRSNAFVIACGAEADLVDRIMKQKGKKA